MMMNFDIEKFLVNMSPFRFPITDLGSELSRVNNFDVCWIDYTYFDFPELEYVFTFDIWSQETPQILNLKILILLKSQKLCKNRGFSPLHQKELPEPKFNYDIREVSVK